MQTLQLQRTFCSQLQILVFSMICLALVSFLLHQQLMMNTESKEALLVRVLVKDAKVAVENTIREHRSGVFSCIVCLQLQLLSATANFVLFDVFPSSSVLYAPSSVVTAFKPQLAVIIFTRM